MIISYVLTAILFILTILYTECFKNFGDAFKSLVLFMLLFLILAIYLNWGYCSKYLKFYIYISKEKIVFFADKQEHTYSINNLVSYQIIKTNNRYTTLQLIFNNKQFTITSFKFEDLKNILDFLINAK